MIDFKVGQTYSLTYSLGSPHNKLITIRGVVDEDYIVYKHYSRPKRLWVYEIKHRASKAMSEEILTLLEDV